MSAAKTTSHITDRREIQMEGLTWRIVEFEGGDSYMLVVQTRQNNAGFTAHFTREQWNEFQSLVQP